MEVTIHPGIFRDVLASRYIPAIIMTFLLGYFTTLYRARPRAIKLNGIVTLEEHFMSEAYLAASSGGAAKWQAFGNIQDLGQRRLDDMDKGKVSLQVISQAPGPEHLFTPTICRASNDQLHEAIKDKPRRLAGFATLSMSSPKKAVLELEKAVSEYGFKGALINNHVGESPEMG